MNDLETGNPSRMTHLFSEGFFWGSSWNQHNIKRSLPSRQSRENHPFLSIRFTSVPQDFLCGGNWQGPQAGQGAHGSSLKCSSSWNPHFRSGHTERLAAKCLLWKLNLQVEEVLWAVSTHNASHITGEQFSCKYTCLKGTWLSWKSSAKQPKSILTNAPPLRLNTCL